MSHDRVVQPLVACLGNPVAGNPTQFVMSRLARDAELDFRFFTSQVELDQFETAFRGVQALGMAGVAIFEPFQARVVPMLHATSDGVRAFGSANVARSDGSTWFGDHTHGESVLRLLRTRFARDRPSEDTLLEPQSIAVWGTERMTQAVQSSLRVLDGNFSVFRCGETIPPEPGVSDSDPTTPEPRTTQVDFRSFDDMQGLERPVRALIVEQPIRTMNLKPKSLVRILQSVAWTATPVCVMMQGRLNSEPSEIRNWLANRQVQVAEEVEWMTHQMATDFQFWTGIEPSLDLIREALEEYLLW